MTRERNALPRFNRYSIPPREGTVQCRYCPSWVKPQGLADHIRAKHPEHAITVVEKPRQPEFSPDYEGECIVCGASPIVPISGMCGPCTWGEADTIDGNW